MHRPKPTGPKINGEKPRSPGAVDDYLLYNGLYNIVRHRSGGRRVLATKRAFSRTEVILVLGQQHISGDYIDEAIVRLIRAHVLDTDGEKYFTTDTGLQKFRRELERAESWGGESRA